jgi:hypothetical protein
LASGNGNSRYNSDGNIIVVADTDNNTSNTAITFAINDGTIQGTEWEMMMGLYENNAKWLKLGNGAYCSAGGTWTNASSRDYKTNIMNLDLNSARKCLQELEPVRFNYKNENDKDEYVGFIAEDVPDLVATTKRKSLSPMDIVGVLAKVVQDQEKRIEQLEEQLKANQ